MASQPIDMQRLVTVCIQIGVVLGGLFAVDSRNEARGTTWTSEVAVMSYRLGQVEKAVNDSMARNVTSAEFAAWTLDFQGRNPNLNVTVFRK